MDMNNCSLKPFYKQNFMIQINIPIKIKINDIHIEWLSNVDCREAPSEIE